MDKNTTEKSAFKENLGRFLLVIFFVLSGIAIINDSSSFEAELVDGYAKSYAKFFELTKIHVILTPAHIAINSKMIALAVATFQLFSSFLIVFNIQLGAKWLIALQIILSILIQNPFYAAKYEIELFSTVILNLGIIGCLCLLCQDDSPQKLKEE